MKNTTRVHRKQWGAVLAGVAMSLLLFGLFAGADSVSDPVRVQAERPAVYLSTSTLPLQVSGVIEAVDSTVVYAETAGVVRELRAREGMSVSAGQVLAVQATPVADARLELAAAERGLSNLNQRLQTELRSGQAAQAVYQARSAAEIAELRAMSNDDRISEVMAQLTSTLEQTTLTLTEAISYINTNRNLFSATGLALYDQVVTDLYGAVPSYFQGGVAQSRGAGQDLQALLATVNEHADPVEVELLARLYEGQLTAVTTLFETGEADVFDRDRMYITDAMQAAYLQQRSHVLQALQTVQATAAAFAQVTDGVLEDTVTQTTNVAVTDIDTELAAVQAEYATLIAAQSDVVATAGERVVAAERQLGRPSAPFAGVVARVFVAEGQYVTPGTPLLSLVGAGAREVVVSVPAYLLPQVAVGQAFLVEGEIVGFVNRFSSVVEGGSGTVVIALSADQSFTVGASIAGTLQLESLDGVFAVPRAYVHFDTDGPFIAHEDGRQARTTVMYDAGQLLYLQVAKTSAAPLVKAVSVSL